MKRTFTFSEARLSKAISKINLFKGVHSNNVQPERDLFNARSNFNFDQFNIAENSSSLKSTDEQNLIDEIEIVEEFKRKTENKEIDQISFDHLSCQKSSYFFDKIIKYSTICINFSKKNLLISCFVLTNKFVYLFKNKVKQIHEEWNFDDHWIPKCNPYTKIDISKIDKIFRNSKDLNTFCLKSKSDFIVLQCENSEEIFDILSKFVFSPIVKINNFDDCIVDDFRNPIVSIGTFKLVENDYANIYKNSIISETLNILYDESSVLFSCNLWHDKIKESILIVCNSHIYIIESNNHQTKNNYNLVDYGRIKISNIQEIKLSSENNSMLFFCPLLEVEETNEIYPVCYSKKVGFQQFIDFENFKDFWCRKFPKIPVKNENFDELNDRFNILFEKKSIFLLSKKLIGEIFEMFSLKETQNLKEKFFDLLYLTHYNMFNLFDVFNSNEDSLIHSAIKTCFCELEFKRFSKLLDDILLDSNSKFCDFLRVKKFLTNEEFTVFHMQDGYKKGLQFIWLKIRPKFQSNLMILNQRIEIESELEEILKDLDENRMKKLLEKINENEILNENFLKKLKIQFEYSVHEKFVLDTLDDTSNFRNFEIEKLGYFLHCAKKLSLEGRRQYKNAIENKSKMLIFQQEKIEFMESIKRGNVKSLKFNDELLIWLQKLYSELIKFVKRKHSKDEIDQLSFIIESSSFEIPSEMIGIFVELEKNIDSGMNEEVKKLMKKLIKRENIPPDFDNENLSERIQYLENFVRSHEKSNFISNEQIENSKNELEILTKINEIETELTDFLKLNLSEISNDEVKSVEDYFRDLLEFQLKSESLRYLPSSLIEKSKEKLKKISNLKKQNDSLTKLNKENNSKLFKYYFCNQKFKDNIQFKSSKRLIIDAFEKLIIYEMKEKPIKSLEDVQEMKKLFQVGITLEITYSLVFENFLDFIDEKEKEIKLKNLIEYNIENGSLDKLEDNLKQVGNHSELRELIISNQIILTNSKKYWLLIKNQITIKENILNIVKYIRRKETKPVMLKCLIQRHKPSNHNEIVLELENVVTMIIEHFMKMSENGHDLKSIGDESNNNFLRYLVRERLYLVLESIFQSGFEPSNNWWNSSSHFWNFIERCSYEAKDTFTHLGEIELYNVINTINEISVKNKVQENVEEFKFMSFICHSLNFGYLDGFLEAFVLKKEVMKGFYRSEAFLMKEEDVSTAISCIKKLSCFSFQLKID
eukprot:gene2546-3508_t